MLKRYMNIVPITYINMRKISKLLICLTILVFISFIFQINVNAQAAEINKGKIYSNATINDKFSPDSVLILLDEETSYSDKIYTVDDFDNVKCSDVTDLTEDKFTKKASEEMIRSMMDDLNKFRKVKKDVKNLETIPSNNEVQSEEFKPTNIINVVDNHEVEIVNNIDKT